MWNTGNCNSKKYESQFQQWMRNECHTTFTKCGEIEVVLHLVLQKYT